MATETKLNLEVVYKGDKRISDNSEKFVEANYSKSDNMTYKMYGDILNVVTDDGSGRKSITTFTAKRVDEAATEAKPAATSTGTTTKK